MKNFSLRGLLVAVGCLASCATPFGEAPGPDGGSGQTNGGTDSDGGGVTLDGGVVDPGPTFSFVQAKNLWVYVQQGQTTNITVNITRSITPGTDIQIIATSKPKGVSVGSLTIPPGSNTGQLAITVDATIPQGPLDDALALQGLADGATVKVAVAFR
ncbi:MAG: hypothetical protein FWD73_11510 [Polyangiaceae bacterium]|nr:hypothetical protein [Polyangiaceae bacterium]